MNSLYTVKHNENSIYYLASPGGARGCLDTSRKEEAILKSAPTQFFPKLTAMWVVLWSQLEGRD